MNLQYTVPKSEKYPNLDKIFDAFNTIMSSLELSIINDKFVHKVYSIAWRGLDIRIELEKKDSEITKIIAEERLRKFQKEFNEIFDIHLLFSDEYKTRLKSLFWVVCWYGWDRIK
jgi:hypothetical protein